MDTVNSYYDGTLNMVTNNVFVSNKNADNDTYTFSDMMKQPDKAEFIKAMINEIEDHDNRGHWTKVLRNTMPKGHKTIMSVWSFKRKRFPDGRIMKHKA